MAAWNDGKTKPHVAKAALEISARFGILNIGGYRSGPDAQDHGLGLAIDVMTTVKGQAVADYAQANAKRLAITYIIWNRAIWDSRNNRGKEPYRGASPHTDHVHISFFPTGGAIETPPVDGLAQNEGCAGMILRLLGVDTTGKGNDSELA